MVVALAPDAALQRTPQTASLRGAQSATRQSQVATPFNSVTAQSATPQSQVATPFNWRRCAAPEGRRSRRKLAKTAVT